jgi:hypothetical protein
VHTEFLDLVVEPGYFSKISSEVRKKKGVGEFVL